MKVAYFIYKILKERVDKILLLSPKRYQVNLKVVTEDDCFFNNFYDLVFIIEKYKSLTVKPQQYKINYSSNFNNDSLSIKAKSNFSNLINKLENGKSINSISSGYLPRYSRQYFNEIGERKENIVDFKSQLYGINHLHLDSHNKNEDSLLYYAIRNDEIFFLKIGSHYDLYSNDVIKNLIREYPDLAKYLKIEELKYAIIDQPKEFLGNEKKKLLINGGNPSPVFVDNKLYTSLNPLITNRTSIDLSMKIFNIKYQVIDSGISRMITHPNVKIHEDEDIIPLIYENGQKTINGNILIGDRLTKKAYEIKVSYLDSIAELDRRINIDIIG